MSKHSLMALLAPGLVLAVHAGHAADLTITSLADAGAGSLRQAIATANATPSACWPARSELIPITSPLRFTSGPPLLPGLMAASVWMSVTGPALRTALTIPRVTVFESTPSAEPTAMTSSPTRAPDTEPSVSTGWF